MNLRDNLNNMNLGSNLTSFRERFQSGAGPFAKFVRRIRGDRAGFIQENQMPTVPDLPWTERTRTYGGGLNDYTDDNFDDDGDIAQQTADWNKQFAEQQREIHRNAERISDVDLENQRYQSHNPLTYSQLNNYHPKHHPMATPEFVTPRSSNYVPPQGEQPPDLKSHSLQNPIDMVEVLNGMEMPEL